MLKDRFGAEYAARATEAWDHAVDTITAWLKSGALPALLEGHSGANPRSIDPSYWSSDAPKFRYPGEPWPRVWLPRIVELDAVPAQSGNKEPIRDQADQLGLKPTTVRTKKPKRAPKREKAKEAAQALYSREGFPRDGAVQHAYREMIAYLKEAGKLKPIEEISEPLLRNALAPYRK